MAFPNPQKPTQRTPQDDTVRLWLSQQQWMSVLQNTERKAQQGPATDNHNDLRNAPRVSAPDTMHCMVRLGSNADHTGTFIVKPRDISTTGLGFYSAQTFAPKSRCTIAIQDAQGHGLVCSARVVWSRAINDELNDVGIQFDKPIEAYWLTESDPLDKIPI